MLPKVPKFLSWYHKYIICLFTCLCHFLLFYLYWMERQRLNPKNSIAIRPIAENNGAQLHGIIKLLLETHEQLGTQFPKHVKKLLLNLEFKAVVLLCQRDVTRGNHHEARFLHLPPGTDWLPWPFSWVESIPNHMCIEFS